MNRLGTAHPRLGADAPHPIGEARDEAKIFAHMLLADKTHRHDAAGGDRDCWAEEPLQHYIDRLA